MNSVCAQFISAASSSWIVDCTEKEATTVMEHDRTKTSSPTKQLPTRMQREERRRGRQEMSAMLQFAANHRDRTGDRKCAGTQTPYSSFNGQPMYTSGEGPQRPTNLPLVSYHTHTTAQSNAQTGFCGHCNNGSTNPGAGSFNSPTSPLNLSTTTRSPVSPLQQQHRPSVITCAHCGPPPYPAGTRRIETSVDLCDPAIEEHFRRSLGKSYQDYLPASTPPGPLSPLSKSPVTKSPISASGPPLSQAAVTMATPSPLSSSASTTPSSECSISIAGSASVDDHFARALGNSTWSEIKAKKEPVQLDILAGSVDDHFTKALGDQWLKIKADKELTRKEAVNGASVAHMTTSSRTQPSQTLVSL
ncbi:uncharacterized protein LOC106176732 isoform X2 [Lingula anatina]|uniref:Uncharacterized protein LOC106176732 isoform X2 n=1 Tax=Lingula anatina TaxID=7574 RepID=A0A1S3JWE6_LINAN|nr:uncharacterized protein LOC106176732 isoform X2 [Lingula anatina]|eukprot:XP_013414693.1 uncharacterized protein LOC106176732 isoform X2 [Lingula anatina]